MSSEYIQPLQTSRRSVLVAGSYLLAGFGLAVAAPEGAAAATMRQASVTRKGGELAAYRPVTVSSTAYAPTPAEFVVDKVSTAGVKGTGWRAAGGDPQWVSVDLQAMCEVTSVRLTFEATAGEPVFIPPEGKWSDGTTGQEILSSYATEFSVEVSENGASWSTIYRTTEGTGGVVEVVPKRSVKARYVRMTATKRSTTNPLGLNGFEVFGSTHVRRVDATGWTDWGRHDEDAPALAVATDGTVPLESGWVLTMDDWAGGDGADLSRTGVDTGGWLPATVPGTVLASLVDQDKLPDPVVGQNNLHIPEALSRHAWWYKRDFDLPRDLEIGRGRHVWLEFDGVNHEADVWLNGHKVGTLTHPFARSAYDVTRLLGADTQALAVKLTPMPVPGSPGDKGPEGEAWVDAGAGQMNLSSPTYLSVSGWDWMPAVRDRATGIWNHVRLRSTGHAVLGDPRVDTLLPNLPDTSIAEVTIVVPVRNADTVDHEFTVAASFDKVKVSTKISVPAGKTVEAVLAPADHDTLTLRNPKLWWPNGYGDPALHDLTLRVAQAGRTSDERTTRFGIRQFGYEHATPLPFTDATDSYTQAVDLDAEYRARYVRVQCGTRATEWGFSMWTLAVVNSDAPATDLALRADVTASSSADGTTPANATDGSDKTRWTSDYADEQWIQVDLGGVQPFDQVDITWEHAYARTFVVQVSADGVTWTDARTVDNTATPLPFNSSNASLRREAVRATTARYVRLQCGRRHSSWGNSLWTLSVLDSAEPGTDLALRQPVTASTAESSYPAVNATDGDAGTRWSSEHKDDQWIFVDLGTAKRFDQVNVLWEKAYPRTYVIQSSDDAETWTDLKTVDLAPTALKISVNGVRVFARGGNWGYDELLRRMPAERMDTAVRMHRDMNFTMIRNWVASSNREEFYAACDAHGVLVWNDFPNAWGMDPPNREVYNTIARDVVQRYRIHPSVVVWCGANEGDPPKAINDGMREAVHSQSPGILYQNNSAGGIVKGGGPYGWVAPDRYHDPELFGGRGFGFHTEIGMPVVSTAESLRNMVGDESEWPISDVWFHHDWSVRGNQNPRQYLAAIEERLGTTTSLDDLARKAQFLNYENTRAMFEAWNSNLWKDASGLLLWMSHPAWHSTVWQTYDYDFDVNGTVFGATSSCERHHVQANPDDGAVIAVNHTAAKLENVTVTADLYDLRGNRLAGTKRATVDVDASATADAFAVPFDSDLPDLHLLRLSLTSAKGTELSRNTYWRYREPQAMRVLNTAKTTKLTVSVRNVDRAGARRQATAIVRNARTAVAAMVRLSLLDDHGDRVLPTQYSDNYLWLLPGESRTVTVSWPAAALPGQRPVLHAEGYNTTEANGRV